MDDFLHNLRMSKDRRFERSRKPYDNQAYKKGRPTDNRKGNFRKQGGEQLTNLLNETIPEIKSKLDELIDQQKRIAIAGERSAEAEERKALAIEQIAQALSRFGQLSGGDATIQPELGKPPLALIRGRSETDENDESGDQAADETIDIIQSMRAQGLSFIKIAEDLNSQNVPTPTGRGKWRGPLVSKVCNETA